MGHRSRSRSRSRSRTRSHSHAAYHPPPYLEHHHSHQHHHTAHHEHHRGRSHSYHPGEDPQLRQWFNTVDSDRSGTLSVTELQNALVNAGNWSRFDLDTVKMLMDMFDVDRSGTIGFAEFAGLWKYIAEWQAVFKRFDRDHSGTIETKELAEALRAFNYHLPPDLLTLIARKYASGAVTARRPPPGITFDRFVRACVTIKTLTDAFRRVDVDNDGWVQLSYADFMRIYLSAP